MIDEGPELAVRLLGHPEVWAGGRRVGLPTRRAMLLLAILAVEGAQSRGRLTALLWPDADETRGRTNLRRTIAYVRDGVGRDRQALVALGDSLAPAPGLHSDLDLVREATAGDADTTRLSPAAEAWRGDFMAGLQADGEDLDAWLGQQREVWHQRLALISERLAELESDAGDSAGGLETVERWLARDPLAEAAHRLRVRLHLERGDRGAALEAYGVCRQLLARELGVEPAAATRELAERARRDEPPAAATAGLPLPEVPMVGRADEHAALVAAWRRAAAGRPQLVLVAGEPGIGKTRLTMEFAGWVRAAGGDVLNGRAFPSSRKLPYQALVEALERRLEAAPMPLPGEPWRSELARILPQLGRPRRHSAESDQPLFEAVARLLRGLSAEAPVLLAVDDVQWLDPDSLALLAYASGALDTVPWLLLVTVREDELESRSGLRDWVAAVARNLPLAEVRLPPLAPSDAERLLELWPEPIRERPSTLVEQAAGRPLLIMETLRHLSAGGDPEGLAPAAREWMQARLRDLDGTGARLAEAAAVLERAVSADLLARVAGLDPSAVEAGLDELVRRRILLAAGGWSFSHEMLRRAAYEALPPGRRRRLHASAAGELDVPANAAEVARHAEQAGDHPLAWERRLQAGHAAVELPAHRVAAEHFAAAVALRPEPSQVWLDLGRAQELAGRPEVAASTYRALLDRARESGAQTLEAMALVRLGELEGRAFVDRVPDELLEEAGEVAVEAGEPGLELEAALAAAQLAAYRMELGRAERDAGAGLLRARRLRRPDLVARSLNLLGFVHQMQGRFKPCLEVSREAAAAYAALGEDLMRLDSEAFFVMALIFSGDWKTAVRRGRRLLHEARRHQNSWAIAHVSLGLAWALYEGGRLQQSLEAADAGVDSARRAGFMPLQVLNAAVAGRGRRDLGQVERALELHEQAWEWAGSLNDLALQAISEELCADLAAAGRWKEAALWAAESRRRWGEARMFVHLSASTVAEALLRVGAPYTTPELPDCDRYRLVGLRVEAVVERFAGRAAAAAAALGHARELALKLDLPLQLAEVDAEAALSGRC